MYAVIKTGGKQYRVAAGDLIKVEKLAGEPGSSVNFNEVLMVGGTVGAPLVDGAVVVATLVETRKGEKVRIFKKTRRQGYRRTRGHRQFESVLRVTAITGAGLESKWDGVVSLVTKAELDARARGLAPRNEAAADETPSLAETVEATAVAAPTVEAEATVDADAEAADLEARKAAKRAAKKAKAEKAADGETPADEA